MELPAPAFHPSCASGAVSSGCASSTAGAPGTDSAVPNARITVLQLSFLMSVSVAAF
ncbi:uncharacterized protein ASCRUDRAFT_76482 [Ascoidea rubescens DSM 1968]|uniref:Uncharacterized protein n=1 Tax=Ascoidea rubescens DSM 1968 TaxID=1344418 RepID=A0A1D2VGA6_9ASCO|nr:hypothetical protein ASCRUDRAFT_76482 [Ascoidea rubescens DSM 1968]ODV60507.1 hypothetical protein ASCRUDRAFT_76482 [Ascoidea rubescens DSM 1968]